MSTRSVYFPGARTAGSATVISMLLPGGTVKLLDFGIAKAAADQRLTMTGTTLGSLYYMSPEQIEGRDDYEALEAAIFDLKRLDRYQRRAWSRQPASSAAHSSQLCRGHHPARQGRRRHRP